MMKLRLLRFKTFNIFALVICIALPALSQEPKAFDKNGDGKLDTSEVEAFLMHKFVAGLKNIDTNKDGIIDLNERDEFVRYYLADIVENLGKKEFYSFDEIGKLYPPKSKSDLYGIRIRDSYEEVTSGVEEKSFSKAKPALGSFARNIAGNENVWSAKGAIMRPIGLLAADTGSAVRSFYLSAFSLIPSISFNRIAGPKKGQDANALQARVGFDLEMAGGVAELQDFRLFGTYATDFDFESKVIAAQFQWEPTPTSLAMGVYREMLSGIVKFRWRFFTHFEYGYVVDAGSKTNLKEKDQFFRLGPKVQMDLSPVFLNSLEASLKWEYLYGPTGTPKDCRLWNLAATYQIDEAGHYNVEAEYSKGQMPLTVEDIETFTFGIGIKF